MSNIEKIKQLRSATGAGFKDCSSAIAESMGDIDKAIEFSRVRHFKSLKKMSREAKEGVLLSVVMKKNILNRSNCETDL